MIKYCVKKWNKNKNKLYNQLKDDLNLNGCEYEYLVRLVVKHILNGDIDESSEYGQWDDTRITIVDNGDYQGTLLFIIPQKTYQPQEFEYLITYVGYGSCSGCDTLQSIQSFSEDKPTDSQLKDYMTLCKDLVCNMAKPFKSGWRNSEGEFDEVNSNEI